MNKGGTPSNCMVRVKKNEIVKEYKPYAHKAFVNELYIYLFAKEKKIPFIPKLLRYDLEKRILVIKNVGESLYDYCKKNDCDYTDFFPKIKKIYEKLIDYGLYHNDMRWKNILYDSKKNKFYLIDFEFTSPKYEDKDDQKIVDKMKDYKGGKKNLTKRNKNNFDKYIGKVVLLKHPKNNKPRYFWIVRKKNNRYIIRSPKIGILINDLNKLKDKDFGPEKIMPTGTKLF